MFALIPNSLIYFCEIFLIYSGQLLGYLATNSRNRPAHYASLNGLSVQPGNKQGDIIATAGGDGTLRIFDVRFCNTSEFFFVYIVQHLHFLIFQRPYIY